MHEWKLLYEIVIILLAALLGGVLLERLKQSALVGYILAGVLLGPSVLHLVEGREGVSLLAELGVALLLFTIGLEFSWPRLRSLGWKAILAGFLQVIGTLLLAALVALGFGLSPAPALAVGAAFSLSSTAVVIRVLNAASALDTAHGRSVLAVLLVQDVLSVPLVLLVTSMEADVSGMAMALTFGELAIKSALFIAALYALSVLAFPRLLAWIPPSQTRELPVLFASFACLGSAWAAHAVGISPALGSFIAGMLLAETDFADQLRAEVNPLRIIFVTLFFASVGMLTDVHYVFSHLPLVLFLVFLAIVGKAAIVWVLFRLLGNPNRISLCTGISLAQTGEFSFVLATAALVHQVIDQPLFQLIVSTTVLTLLVTPYMVTYAPSLSHWLTQRIMLLGDSTPHDTSADNGLSRHVVVVGFGPVGRSVAEALKSCGISVLVVDLNPQSMEEARALGFHAQVGDATQGDIFAHMQLGAARALVLTLPDITATESLVSQARMRYPHLQILVRARYNMHAEGLSHAGADIIVDEEREAGRKLSQTVITTLDLLEENA